MIGTPIQWADDSVNPTMGCEGSELHVPARPDASTCYAFSATTFRAGHPGFPTSFEDVTLFPGRMRAAARRSDLLGRRRLLHPWRDRLPRMVFISDMGDSLSKSVSFDYLATEIIEAVDSEAGRHHIWQWLTKRPRRMAAFASWLLVRGVPWPTNLWAGTSVTAQDNVGRVVDLGEVGDAQTVRFLSLEPQRERIDPALLVGKVAWLIQGGESGKRARPFDLVWAREVRDACAASGTAYFLKQLGRRPLLDGVPMRLKDRHGGDWHEWPVDLRVRRYPDAALREIPRTAGDKNLVGVEHLRGRTPAP